MQIRQNTLEESAILQLNGGIIPWTLTDAFEGTQIFGSTGSGKSSGSGRTLAIQCLKAGLGGLVLTAKADECNQWQKYAAAAGRNPEDVVVLEPGSDFSFGFFEYERRIALAEGMPVTEPVVNLFSVLFEVAQRRSGAAAPEAYWLLAVKQLVRNAVDLLILASKPITFDNLYALITSAPVTSAGATEISAVIAGEKQPSGLFAECLIVLSEPGSSKNAGREINLLLAYWLHEYVNLAPETRSSVVSYFTSIADVFTRGVLQSLFSPAKDPKFEFNPELSREGKILIFNLPVKRYFESGQMAQVLYKYIWQRAAERQVMAGRDIRPMFLWADESQFFVNSYDMLFQTTARSAKVATFYLTQNISNYYAVMPGQKSEPETDSLMGNFNTKIFHANTDAVTNTWASNLIGKNWQFRKSLAASVSSTLNDPANQSIFSLKSLFMSQGRGNTTNVNRSKNEILDYQVIPLEFYKLKKGGLSANREVEGIFTQGGRVLKDGKIFQKLVFQQAEE